jgi:activator of 2-hydroxyglutaryl-CoA dehydratase
MKYYLDAGTTYSKLISIENDKKKYSIIPSKSLRELNLNFAKTCGHMCFENIDNENEIVALAKGCKNKVDGDATVLDLGSRDAKWIKFRKSKFTDMDWNTSCASSTGATVEMLLKFYEIDMQDLKVCDEKFPVTCGIFGLEKIMDDISKGIDAKIAISKFVHGIAFNTWNFAQNPDKIYLSGGFCENKCFVDSLKKYCDVELLGRFVLCEGLIDE